MQAGEGHDGRHESNRCLPATLTILWRATNLMRGAPRRGDATPRILLPIWNLRRGQRQPDGPVWLSDLVKDDIVGGRSQSLYG
jgi:hypothetical protein